MIVPVLNRVILQVKWNNSLSYEHSSWHLVIARGKKRNSNYFFQLIHYLRRWFLLCNLPQGYINGQFSEKNDQSLWVLFVCLFEINGGVSTEFFHRVLWSRKWRGCLWGDLFRSRRRLSCAGVCCGGRARRVLRCPCQTRDAVRLPARFSAGHCTLDWSQMLASVLVWNLFLWKQPCFSSVVKYIFGRFLKGGL